MFSVVYSNEINKFPSPNEKDGIKTYLKVADDKIFSDWLEHLKASNTTLVRGLIRLPFSLFWDASEFVYNTAVR